MCEAVDAIKEAVASKSPEVREAVDRLYSCVARPEVSEAELEELPELFIASQILVKGDLAAMWRKRTRRPTQRS